MIKTLIRIVLLQRFYGRNELYQHQDKDILSLHCFDQSQRTDSQDSRHHLRAKTTPIFASGKDLRIYLHDTGAPTKKQQWRDKLAEAIRSGTVYGESTKNAVNKICQERQKVIEHEREAFDEYSRYPTILAYYSNPRLGIFKVLCFLDRRLSNQAEVPILCSRILASSWMCLPIARTA